MAKVTPRDDDNVPITRGEVRAIVASLINLMFAVATMISGALTDKPAQVEEQKRVIREETGDLYRRLDLQDSLDG